MQHFSVIATKINKAFVKKDFLQSIYWFRCSTHLIILNRVVRKGKLWDNGVGAQQATFPEATADFFPLDNDFKGIEREKDVAS